MMRWNKVIRHGDVERAYKTIQKILDQSGTPQFVIVDLTKNPKMPMTETLLGALRGPYAHPMLNQWLVIGQHRGGQIVAQILSQTTRKRHVVWFNSVDKAERHLEEAISSGHVDTLSSLNSLAI